MGHSINFNELDIVSCFICLLFLCDLSKITDIYVSVLQIFEWWSNPLIVLAVWTQNQGVFLLSLDLEFEIIWMNLCLLSRHSPP